jgi:uncharacterized repeat protein (TIGR01451 family)
MPYSDSDSDRQYFDYSPVRIVKTAVLVNGESTPLTYLQAGDVITYTITVENTGVTSINRNNLIVSDPQATTGPTYVSSNLNSNANLEPGEIWTYTATYIIKVADVERGWFTNTATVTATMGNEVFTDSDDETVTSDDMPSLSVTKTADPKTYNSVGDVITYTIVVENTGNVTLTNIAVADPKTGLEVTIASLAARRFGHLYRNLHHYTCRSEQRQRSEHGNGEHTPTTTWTTREEATETVDLPTRHLSLTMSPRFPIRTDLRRGWRCDHLHDSSREHRQRDA